MRLIFIALLLLAVNSWAESLRLPSYIALSGARGNQSYKDSSIAAGITGPANWQLELGGQRTITAASDDSSEIAVREGHLGIASDPDRLLSFRASGETWSAADSASASGGRGSITLAPGFWTFTVEYAKQKIVLKDLPFLVSTTGETEVNDESWGVRVSTLAVRHWNFYFTGSTHTYDRDLSRLDEFPAITLSRMPDSVMTSLLGLNKNDVALGAVYFFPTWDLGFEGGRSISAVDEAKTRRLGVTATYYVNSSWSAGINSFAYRPESSEESNSPSHSTSVTLTFKW